MAMSKVVRNASPARTAVSRTSFEPKSISVPDSSMSIANPSEAKTGKGWAPGSIRRSPVCPRMIPPTSSPTNTGTRNRFPAANSGPKRPARTTRTREVNTAHSLYGEFGRRPNPPVVASGFGARSALFSLGERGMFKWLLFFVLILAAILAFVSWVMGIPIPGFSGFQQNPFNQ
jgi:hypothetical protein